METGNAAQTTNGHRSLADGNCTSEAENIKRRFSTYSGWNGDKSALQLAISGFKYTGRDDRVVCESCGLQLFNWLQSYDAIEVHRTHSPNCSYLQKWFSLNTESPSLVVVRNGEESSPPPKYPYYEKYEDRVASYFGWPLKCDLQSPTKMAAEGFFYVGSADRARCFQCGLTLRDWDDDDAPLEAHTTWSPECVFAQKRQRDELRGISSNPPVKKSELADNVSETSMCNGTAHSGEIPTGETRSRDDSKGGNVGNCEPKKEELCNGIVCNGKDLTNHCDKTADEEGAVGGQADGNDVTSGAVGGQADSNDVKSGMRSAMIEAVLEFGCSMEHIEKAMEDERKKTGKHFPNAMSLYGAVIEIENNSM